MVGFVVLGCAFQQIGAVMKYTVIFAALLLAACQPKTLSELSYSETKQVFSQIHQRCTDQGIPPGHPEREACIKQELTKEDATRRADVAKDRSAVACINANGVVMCQ